MEEKVIVSVSRYEQLIEAEARLNMLADAYKTLKSYNFDSFLEVFFGKKEEKPE